MAGDLGASKNVTPFMFHREDNISFIGSGMGGEVMDNFIIVDEILLFDAVCHGLPCLCAYTLPFEGTGSSA